MTKYITNELKGLSEEKYQKFSSKLIPNIDANSVLGVRLPILRKIAKRITSEDWKTFLQENTSYFEETMLQGMVIGLLKIPMEEKLKLVADFVPKIDNWSVCDSFCCGLKIKETDKSIVWEFLQAYLKSDKPYDIRFAVVLLCFHYIDEDYAKNIFQAFDKITHEDYYVKMGVAWAVSIFYLKLPEITFPYLENNKLDLFTHNKSLQKIIESLRVNEDIRNIMRGMKRK